MQMKSLAMQKQFVPRNRTVAYTLHKSRRARKMRVAVHRDGRVVVTVPFRMKESVAEEYLQSKANWINLKIEYFQQFGIGVMSKYQHTDYVKYKDAAYQLVEERVKHFNNVYQFPYNSIRIKNQKTRWGSCSGKGNLNFNFRIALIPSHIADYIIVHELCHIKELNHSSRFWNLIAKTIPEYHLHRAELKLL